MEKLPDNDDEREYEEKREDEQYRRELLLLPCREFHMLMYFERAGKVKG